MSQTSMPIYRHLRLGPLQHADGHELQHGSRSRRLGRLCPNSSTRRSCRHGRRARRVQPAPAINQALADAMALRQLRRPYARQEGLCNHLSSERRIVGAPPLAHDLNPKLRSCHCGCHTRHHAPDTLNAGNKPNHAHANKAAITRRLLKLRAAQPGMIEAEVDGTLLQSRKDLAQPLGEPGLDEALAAE